MMGRLFLLHFPPQNNYECLLDYNFVLLLDIQELAFLVVSLNL